MSYGAIPFAVPLEFLAQPDAGELVRYGGILKDVSNGKIVGHLRIKAIDTSIGRLEGHVTDIADHLNKADIHKALRRIGDTMEKLAEAPCRKSMAGTKKVLDDVEENLRSGFNELVEGARVMFNLEVLDEELLRTLMAGHATCSAAQTKTLVWLDELTMATNRAQNHTQKLNDLARLMPVDVLSSKRGGNAEAALRLNARRPPASSRRPAPAPCSCPPRSGRRWRSQRRHRPPLRRWRAISRAC
jgi:hypothetical protein